MDNIWDRNPLKAEVIGRCGGDENNRMTTHNRQKSNAKNDNIQFVQTCSYAWFTWVIVNTCFHYSNVLIDKHKF